VTAEALAQFETPEESAVAKSTDAEGAEGGEQP